MGDALKKLLNAIKELIAEVNKTRSLKPVEKLLKSFDVETLKKQAKELADKAQKSSGVDLKKLASKSGLDVDKLSKQAHDLAGKAEKASQDAQGPPGRPMKFPYTFSAKVAHFPWKFYVQNNWIWRYYVYGFIVCLPIFMYFTGMAQTPANMKKWKDQKKAEKAGHH